MGDLILNPDQAAEAVCHDEQIVVWVDDMISAIGMETTLFNDLSYSDLVELHEVVKEELKRIIKDAFAHPEAQTILRRS